MKRWRSVLFVIAVLLSLSACKKEPTIQDYLELGQKYLAELNYEEAVVAFTKAIQLDPKHAAAYSGLAEAYVGLDDYDQAIQTLERGYEAVGGEDLLRQKKRYEQDLQRKETSKELTQLFEAYLEQGNQKLIWEYMGKEAYQRLFDELPGVIVFETESNRSLLLYPCGHCYYGTLADGKRSGEGIWAACDYEEGYVDLFHGSWKEDYPNGNGKYWIKDLTMMDGVVYHEGEFSDGFFAELQDSDFLDGVLHAMPGQEAELSMEERWFSMELLEEVQMLIEEEAGLAYEMSDVLTDQMVLLHEGQPGIIKRYPERGTYMICLECDKGADVPYVIVDGQGTFLLTGYEDAIWAVEGGGYARLLFCNPGSETESEYIYEIAMGEMEGDVYLEFYDESFQLLEKQMLESEHHAVEGRSIYPEFPGEPIDYRALYEGNFDSMESEVTWEEVEDGFLVYNSEGEEIGHIRIHNPEAYHPVMVEGFLGLWEPEQRGFRRLYAVRR